MKEEIRTAAIGEVMVITLDENPTTGYVWEAGYDSAYFDLLGKDYRRTGAAIGGGGISTFSFLPKKSGNSELLFTLSRPWENEALKVEKVKIQVLPMEEGGPL